MPNNHTTPPPRAAMEAADRLMGYAARRFEAAVMGAAEPSEVVHRETRQTHLEFARRLDAYHRERLEADAQPEAVYFDGWYASEEDAGFVLDGYEADGATPVGLVQSPGGTWGLLYLADKPFYENDRLSAWIPTWRRAAAEEGGAE